MSDDLRDAMLCQKRHIIPGWIIRLGSIYVVVDVIWLLIAPLSLWVIAVIYVPIMGAALNSLQAWIISVTILVLIFLSLFLHSLAHIATAKACGGSPDWIFLSPLGDPAQFWPAAPNAGSEALVALAGPLVQGSLAALFYVLWNLQINPFINITNLFLAFFNLGLMAFNLIPAFPFDGGRLMRAVIWRILGLPGLATRLVLRSGLGMAAGFLIWGIILICQQARFSLATGMATFVFSGLIVISLALWRKWKWNWPEPATHLSLPAISIRSSLVVLLLLPLVSVTLGFIPLNEGLEAPGFTASVEPMVQLPPQYRHQSSGSLILTSVISQAPILVGEWVYAHLDSSIKLEPEDQIVPSTTTAQNVSREDFHMLLNSETTAIIVGLRLAGYPVDIQGYGAGIVSISPQSPASRVLQPGDVITSINSKPITSVTDLTDQLKLQTLGAILQMKIIRNGKTLSIKVPTMQPSQPDGPVRIGISVETQETGFTLPFPVRIVTQKINGGPSAGLMFTLGVYDLVTSHDLTGGRIIAGTGTIDQNGNVGIIAGVQQKVVAAEHARAQYFLCPPDNYRDALAVARHIQVVEVATAREAIDFLRSLPPLDTIRVLKGRQNEYS